MKTWHIHDNATLELRGVYTAATKDTHSIKMDSDHEMSIHPVGDDGLCRLCRTLTTKEAIPEDVYALGMVISLAEVHCQPHYLLPSPNAQTRAAELLEALRRRGWALTRVEAS